MDTDKTVEQAVSQETALPIRPMKLVEVGQAVEVDSAPPLNIFLLTRLWISWARIAMKHEAIALAARQEMQQANTIQSQLLRREVDAGLIGICAVAFALEALSRELVDLRVVPQATLDAWVRNKLSADKVIVEVLKHAVDSRGLSATWNREVKWLFTVRGRSVHHRVVLEPPQAHALGMNVSPAHVTYSAENCTRAVNLLVSILERCRDKSKPRLLDWPLAMRDALDQLIGSRGEEG
jgi:hypothetical protein